MLLRTRISVLVSLVFVITFAGLVGVAIQRDRLIAEPQARIAISGVDALWDKVIAGAAVPLTALIEELVGDSSLATAIASADPNAVREGARPYATDRLASGVLTDLQVMDAEGRLLFAASAKPEPGRLLDLGTIANVASGEAVTGIRQADQEDFRIVAARSLPLPTGQVAVIALASPIDPALDEIGRALGGQVYMLNTRGRVIDQAGEEEWSAFGLTLPQRTATVTDTRLHDRLFAVTSVPLSDVSQGTAGLLITIQDATESLGAVRQLTTLTLIAAGIILVVILIGLSWYMRVSFRPLDRAVDALGALARGDTTIRLGAVQEDEIGRIAKAVGSLRQNLEALGDTRRQRELQRRRQERFVRRQMEEMADALEPSARAEVLSDLRRIVAAGGKPRPPSETSVASETGGPSNTKDGDAQAGSSDAIGRLIREDDLLGPLAAVLQQMSGRVVDQHRRLTELVTRLQEALVRETELASLQQELQIARDLQRSVLPIDFPDRPTYQVHGIMESAKEVGGDFYDFFDRQDGLFVVVIADVSGKGVPAAFFMAICRTLLKTIALFEADPATCVRQLNDLLSAGNDQMMFVTLFFGVYDPATGKFDYINAGHNPPFIASAGGDVKELPISGDMAVAVLEDLPFTNQTVTLAPGDRLVLYTDGMTEAFSPHGDQFGEAALAEAIKTTRPVACDQVTKALVDIVHQFEDGGDQSDDMTLLVLERKAADYL